MPTRTVADIEERIKRLKEETKRRQGREKIAGQGGLTRRDVSDARLLSEFSVTAARFPDKS